jgi:hypothetical protein
LYDDSVFKCAILDNASRLDLVGRPGNGAGYFHVAITFKLLNVNGKMDFNRGTVIKCKGRP